MKITDQWIKDSACADGTWPRYTTLGGYTLLYLTPRGDTLCHACARESWRREDDDKVTYVDTYDEGSVLSCDNCYVAIEPSYGDPDAKEGAK